MILIFFWFLVWVPRCLSFFGGDGHRPFFYIHYSVLPFFVWRSAINGVNRWWLDSFPWPPLKFHFFCPVFGLYILGVCPLYSVVLEHIRSKIWSIRITFVYLYSELRRHSTVRRSATYVVLCCTRSWELGARNRAERQPNKSGARMREIRLILIFSI